jgi:hypothetical protein
MEKKNNRENMKQKTDFNKWSISYLRDIIFQCSKCKKRNTIILSSSNTNNTNLQGNGIIQPRQKQFQNCLYCGNPNYV